MYIPVANTTVPFSVHLIFYGLYASLNTFNLYNFSSFRILVHVFQYSILNVCIISDGPLAFYYGKLWQWVAVPTPEFKIKNFSNY